MTTSARIAAAMASGYLLGRRRKIKLAIVVGGFLAGKRIATTPRGLIKQANDYIEANPELAKLSDSLRTTLVDSARQAAVGTASSSINRLSDTIHDRVGKLALAEPAGDNAEDDTEQDTEQEADQEQPAQDAPEPAAKKAAPKKRQAAKKSATTTSTGKKSASSGSSAPAKKSTSPRGSRTAKKAGSRSGAKARG